MPLPDPIPGLVVQYEYLWRHEHHEYGAKKRPCVIVFSMDMPGNGKKVAVAPITHREPKPGMGIEIPANVKKHLGLDDQQSWVIVDDLNVFLWPGVDIYPVSTQGGYRFHYGIVPPRFFQKIKEAILQNRQKVQSTNRDA